MVRRSVEINLAQAANENSSSIRGHGTTPLLIDDIKAEWGVIICHVYSVAEYTPPCAGKLGLEGLSVSFQLATGGRILGCFWSYSLSSKWTSSSLELACQHAKLHARRSWLWISKQQLTTEPGPHSRTATHEMGTCERRFLFDWCFHFPPRTQQGSRGNWQHSAWRSKETPSLTFPHCVFLFLNKHQIRCLERKTSVNATCYIDTGWWSYSILKEPTNPNSTFASLFKKTRWDFPTEGGWKLWGATERGKLTSQMDSSHPGLLLFMPFCCSLTHGIRLTPVTKKILRKWWGVISEARP